MIESLGKAEGLPSLGLPGLGGIFDETDTDRTLAGLSLSNERLLAAIRQLSHVKDATTNRHRKVDYRHLGAEELGSIYEFLLELRLTPAADLLSAKMIEVDGNARKTTGSFYTHTAIIECLLDSTLEPLLDAAVERGVQLGKTSDSASQTKMIVDELLKLTVCDPACGSGHFLVAASRRIAKRVAAVREGNPEPALDAIRGAMQQVVTHCIYGVDLNPMAVELAKVSLWLEALEPGRPLGFLDAHIKEGNALVGTSPKLLARGVPTAAFTQIEGDDGEIVKDLKTVNSKEHQGQIPLFYANAGHETYETDAALASQLQHITNRKVATLHDVQEQAKQFEQWRNSSAYVHAKHLADAWCASFFWNKTKNAPRTVTQALFLALTSPGREPIPADTDNEIHVLADRYKFFHWHLEFPEVFYTDTHNSNNTNDQKTGIDWQGGFSCVVGNPPWDTLSPDEKEFFSTYNPEVRTMNKKAREKAVASLISNPVIRERWRASRRDSYALVHFLKRSGRYRLFARGHLGKGDFNVYRMFVESALALTQPQGAVAQVTPSGIYNGANAQAIRAELFENWTVKLILGFINTKEAWFDGAHAAMGFGAYSAHHYGKTVEFSAGFQIKNPAELAAALQNPIRLTVDAVRSQSQQALTIGDSLGGVDSETADQLYSEWPAFSTDDKIFPRHTYQREIDMGTDRTLYTDDEPGLPLYEGRMVSQYDHRAKAYVSGRGRSAVWKSLPFDDPQKEIRSQWRVPPRNTPRKVENRINRFRLGFCDVTAPSNERSLVAALIPPQVICGHKVPTILYPEDAEWVYPLWLAAANSLCMDFLARKKVTLTMALNVLDSLPFPRLHPGDQVLDEIAPIALRLTCTSPEMTPFWNKMNKYGWTSLVASGQVPAEALTDEISRAHSRAMIDAIVARRLFNLERRQLEHILSTFGALENKERRKYDDYQTRTLVLREFDKIS